MFSDSGGDRPWYGGLDPTWARRLAAADEPDAEAVEQGADDEGAGTEK